jgi:hypothetical protein
LDATKSTALFNTDLEMGDPSHMSMPTLMRSQLILSSIPVGQGQHVTYLMNAAIHNIFCSGVQLTKRDWQNMLTRTSI